jgi:hypothetical protein
VCVWKFIIIYYLYHTSTVCAEWLCTNTCVSFSFNWKQLLLINDPESQLEVAGKSTCHLMMKTFANYLKLEEIMYTPWDTTSDGGLNYTENLKYQLGYKYTSKCFCSFQSINNTFNV